MDLNILVSACLLGVNCRYDGTGELNENVKKLMDGKVNLIPVCPEQLGGMKTPRNPVEIKNGSGNDVIDGNAGVFDRHGNEFTREFLNGANELLKLAKLFGCKKAILKSKSPSCGSEKIYDGSFSRTLKDGMGVSAAFLKNEGIEVISEKVLKREMGKDEYGRS